MLMDAKLDQLFSAVKPAKSVTICVDGPVQYPRCTQSSFGSKFDPIRSALEHICPWLCRPPLQRRRSSGSAARPTTGGRTKAPRRLSRGTS